MQQVISELQRLQRRSRFMLLVQRLAVTAAWLVGALLIVILSDYAFRWPSAMRLILLLGGAGALLYLSWTYLRPAVLFQPSLTQLALRVERVLPAVAGRLASSVEFAAAGVDQANELAARTVRETQTRLTGESVTTVIDSRRTWRDLLVLLAIAAVAAILMGANPAGAWTGVQRVFLPYGSVKWPARTGVESLTTAAVHPRGQALALRAGVTRGPSSQRVDANYRIRIDGAYQPWQRIVLTHQTGGSIHERLVDTSAPGSEEVEYFFATEDDETQPQRIRLVPPPSVRRASLTVTPPLYASKFVAPYSTELGQGLDNRAVTDTPSLNGSTAALRLELNKPVPVPESLAETFGWADIDKENLEFTIDEENRAVWNLTWTLTATRTLALNLIDEHGLSNSDPIAYRIEVVQDHPPTVSITQPPSDETVLPTAVVELRAEARDDVALANLAVEAHVETGGRTAEETLASAAAWEKRESLGVPTAAMDAALDLASLHVAAGDVVLVSGVAADVYANQTDLPEQAASHTTRSAVRRLRVIAETDFAAQLRRQLGGIRQNAIRIEAQQAELQEDVTEHGLQPGSGMERAQGQIGERIAAQRASVQDIERLIQQNRLDDPQLAQILHQANDLLNAAGRAANKAVEAMEGKRQDGEAAHPKEGQHNEAGGDAASQEARQGDATTQGSQPQGDATRQQPRQGEATSQQSPESENPESQIQNPKSESDREIVEAQQEVRDELSDLIKLLDRDEDTWVVKRQLESLLKEQAELEQLTAKLGEQTIGRTPEELPEPQRTELDKIAQRQRDLRDEARKMIENMRQRAKAMEQVDAEAAQSMRSAADTAEQRQLDQDMENAAQKAQQNQMASATASQQSAQSTMQRMLNDIDSTRRAQAQQLIRKLASLVESIQRLISVQENELHALGLAKDTGNFGDLDRSMIRLNQNTQSVAGEARAAGAEARRIARTLDRAADSQGVAIAAFRAQPVNVEDAQAAENRSLELLKEAKQLAESLQKQTQDQEVQRRREELITAYRNFAERQIAVREETLPLSNLPQLDRRQLVDARRLGSAQDEIRTGLNEMRDVTSEILDSPIFVHVHRAIDSWSSAITDSLSNGVVNVDITDRQQQIADSIGRLIKALEESASPPPEFENQQQQQQQGGDGQMQPSLIPPIAQLKLLREIQEQVYNLTKDLDGRNDLDDGRKRTRLRDLGQQQRELMDLGKQMLEQLQQQQQNLPAITPETKPEEVMPE